MIDVFNSKYHIFYSFYRKYDLYYHYSCPEVIDVWVRPIATYLSDIAHFLAPVSLEGAFDKLIY